MRNIMFLFICSLLIAGGMASNAQINPQQDNEAAIQNSPINVIGYFSKNDTLIYWINQSRWELSPSDTIKTAGISTKIRLTVVDSTSTGYKMDYTVLESRCDSTADSNLNNFQNKIAENISKKLVGTTINFETDEYGSITKINNLGQIKRQAKSIYQEVIKDLSNLPEIAALKNFNIDIKKITKIIDSDKLIDGYLNELKLLFLYHGSTFDIGESHTHEDETETTYENDTYVTATFDPTNYTYSITTDIVSILPQESVKDLTGKVVGLLGNDSITENFNQSFDAQVNHDCIHDSYFSSKYMSQGWPYEVVKQTTRTIDGLGKSTQTYIYLDYINY